MRVQSTATVLGVTAFFFVVGCGGGGTTGSAGGGTTAQTRAANSASASTSTEASVGNGGIVGIGATLPDWDAHHSPNSDAGGWAGPEIGGGNREWNVIVARDGRIVSYVVNFAPHTSQTAALARVMTEFPSDAKAESPTVVNSAPQSGNSCAWFTVKSATLAASLRPLGLRSGVGLTDVLLTSDPSTPTVYDPSNVQSAQLNVLPEQPIGESCEMI